MLGCGIVVLLVWIVQTLRDRERNRYHGDGGLWPTCEPEQWKMWGLILCLLLLPVGLIAGGAAMIQRSLRPAEDAVEYWHGCGYYNPVAPVNPGGKILWACLGSFFLCMCCVGAGACKCLYTGRSNRTYVGDGPAARAARAHRSRALQERIDSAMAHAQERNAAAMRARSGDAPSQAVTATGASAVGAPPPPRARITLAAQMSMERLGHVSLQLSSPVRVVRAASHGRLQLGTAARPPVVNAVVCTPTHVGPMKKVIPSHIGPTKLWHFVLFDRPSCDPPELQYYDKPFDSPGAVKHGKLGLHTVTALERISRTSYDVVTRNASEYAIVLRVSSRAVDWTLDPGSAVARDEWESHLARFVGGGAGVAQTAQEL